MAEVARPVSLRLAPRHIEALRARAHTVSGTLTGVARELILTGLAGGDNKALGERLMQIERRLAALEGLAREVSETARHIDCCHGRSARQARCSAERAVLCRGGGVMQHTKALFLGALFFGIGTVTAINEIGIGVYAAASDGTGARNEQDDFRRSGDATGRRHAGSGRRPTTARARSSAAADSPESQAGVYGSRIRSKRTVAS